MFDLISAITAGLLFGVALTGVVAALLVRSKLRRLRQLEKRARTAERLDDLSTLTSGLAHEIKNPLSTVNLNLQLLQEDINDLFANQPMGAETSLRLASVQRRFTLLGREIQRLRDILEDFLKYAGRIKLVTQPMDVNELVDELVDFFSPQTDAARIHLRAKLATTPAMVDGDMALLKQAVLNLMLNATHAMTDARDHRRQHGGADELIVQVEHLREGGLLEVCIHVIDTGPGIPADQINQIMKPYVSHRKGGTGLGLPTARRIVEEHGGSLVVHSEPGQGSDFCITLPAAKGEAVAS